MPPLIACICEFRLAFFPENDTLPFMTSSFYFYAWRFTYRSNRKRGAAA